jgi:chromosome segregation ATPase
MKTEFLKNLGITEQSVIDQIMAENGRDVNAAKADLNNLKQQVTDLQGQITAKDNEIATLNTKVGEVETLRNENAQLQTDKTNLTNELNTKVSEIKMTHAIESGVRDAKARNVKAVIAQLDMSKITYENDELNGLAEQLEALKSGEDTSFLFGEVKPTPAGTHHHTPPASGGNPQTSNSFAEAVAKAIGKN